MNHSTASLALLGLLSAPALHAADFSLYSDPADFEIRKELDDTSPQLGQLTTQAVDAESLDVWYSGLNETYRAFMEFDLSALAGQGPTVGAATLNVYRTQAVYPGGKVVLLGATVNRAAPLDTAAPATLLEFDSAEYTQLEDEFAPNAAPFEAAQTFTLDVTAYIQARYDDYLADPTLDTVILRLQSPGGISTDTRFASGNNAIVANQPRIDVTVVPEPASLALIAVGSVLIAARRPLRRRASAWNLLR